jgi:hypothetical protein
MGGVTGDRNGIAARGGECAHRPAPRPVTPRDQGWQTIFARLNFPHANPGESFILSIRGSCNKGEATRSLYHFKLLVGGETMSAIVGCFLGREWGRSAIARPRRQDF